MTDSKLPLYAKQPFSELTTHIMPSVLIRVTIFSHTFATRSVTSTYIFWPSRWNSSHNFYFIPWSDNGASMVTFVSLTHIQYIKNSCHTIVGLTIAFKLNFMDSTMIPWFLSLENSTQNGAGQRVVCSKTGIITEGFRTLNMLSGITYV